MIVKKQDKFAVHMSQIATNLKEGAIYFAEYKVNHTSDLTVFSEKMKEYESKGDTLVHGVIKDLHNAFITYIEREDLFR